MIILLSLENQHHKSAAPAFISNAQFRPCFPSISNFPSHWWWLINLSKSTRVVIMLKSMIMYPRKEGGWIGNDECLYNDVWNNPRCWWCCHTGFWEDAGATSGGISLGWCVVLMCACFKGVGCWFLESLSSRCVPCCCGWCDMDKEHVLGIICCVVGGLLSLSLLFVWNDINKNWYEWLGDYDDEVATATAVCRLHCICIMCGWAATLLGCSLLLAVFLILIGWVPLCLPMTTTT